MKLNTLSVQISGVNVLIHLRESLRSKRLSLKLHQKENVFYLTTPPRAKQHDIMAFIQNVKPWMEKMLVHHQTENIPLTPGNTISVLGRPIEILYSYADKPSVTLESHFLHVKGFDAIIVPGLTKDWLRSHIFRYLSEKSQEFAKQIERDIASINIKETLSRWGSCSSTGTLSYSWRLVFAPEAVAEYICAHEVAHLIEMNHSAAFWSIVAKLCPFYRVHREWLKSNGKDLFRYG